MANRLLEVTNLEVAYGDVGALWGVSIHVDPGSIVAIVGANGAGKTTLFRMITGQDKPEARRDFSRGRAAGRQGAGGDRRHGHRACAGRARPV